MGRGLSATFTFVINIFWGFGETSRAGQHESTNGRCRAGVLVSDRFPRVLVSLASRAGALSVLCANRSDAERTLSQLKVVIRANYSTPQTHGPAVVAAVLNTPALRAQWEQELSEMRQRIKLMRQSWWTASKPQACNAI